MQICFCMTLSMSPLLLPLRLPVAASTCFPQPASSTCFPRPASLTCFPRPTRSLTRPVSAALQSQAPVTTLDHRHHHSPQHSVLCLSNGHGEDAIAVSILTELTALAGEDVKVEALPLVGEGHAYRRKGIATLGPAKTMPSGGFLYMDFSQLIGDMQAGLLALTMEQWRTVTQWVDRNPDGVLLAVGDVVPLAFAWLASSQKKRRPRKSSFFAFIGTAKSEFYVRGGDGSRLRNNLEFVLFPGSVYYPWERAMMADSHCSLVVPRDDLTTQYLQKSLTDPNKVQSLGNPMMDDLEPTGGLSFLTNYKPAKFIAVLPGSRAPEVYRNWKQLLVAAQEASSLHSEEKLVFLAPLVPALEPESFERALLEANWQPQGLKLHSCNVGGSQSAWAYDVRLLHGDCCPTWPANNGVALVAFERENAVFILVRGNFNDVAYWAEAGMAMAGTATEQLVGQGKPVFTIPGEGPQFTSAFAEAQSRLLGESVLLEPNAKELARSMKSVLSNPDQLLQIARNGSLRMGPEGASRRISQQVWSLMLNRSP